MRAPAQSLEDLTKITGGRNFRVSSCNADWIRSNVDFVPILPGKTLTLADLKGPGTIRRIWLTILPSEAGYSRLMTLRIYWDGEKEPSVQCPIGDFFGVGHGLDAVVDSIPVRASSDGKARSCYWSMPFRKSARITVSNDGNEATWCFYYSVDGEYAPVTPSTPYFHAMYRQEYPCRPGNYVVADIRGTGHYVGTVLSVRSTADGWWGEGNDYFYVDGAREPTLRGTGLEDYFGEAWGLRPTTGPYEGCSVFEGGFAGGRGTCYRWHAPDPVRFEHSLRVEFQHMGVGVTTTGQERNNVERPDEYSSVGFWYQTGGHAPYPAMPEGYDRLPFDYRRFVEAELVNRQPPASGRAETVSMNGLHGGAELDWSGGQVGADLDLPFDVPIKGRYQAMVLTSHRQDGGVGRFLVDGKPLTDRISFYSSGFDPLHEVALEMTDLDAGHHLLTLRCLGKPSESDDGNWFGIDGFVIQPVRKSTK